MKTSAAPEATAVAPPLFADQLSDNIFVLEGREGSVLFEMDYKVGFRYPFWARFCSGVMV